MARPIGRPSYRDEVRRAVGRLPGQTRWEVWSALQPDTLALKGPAYNTVAKHLYALEKQGDVESIRLNNACGGPGQKIYYPKPLEY